MSKSPLTPDAHWQLESGFPYGGDFVRIEKAQAAVDGLEAEVRGLRELLREASFYCMGRDATSENVIKRINEVLK